VSQKQRGAIEQLLRHAPLDLGGDIKKQRLIFDKMMAAVPVPTDVSSSPTSLGGIPVVDVEVDGIDAEKVIPYLHGGAESGSNAGRSGLPRPGAAHDPTAYRRYRWSAQRARHR
jgi:monoterpene epsilon-lactone hydrolase